MVRKPPQPHFIYYNHKDRAGVGRIGVRKPPQTTFDIIKMGMGWVGRGTVTTPKPLFIYYKDGNGVE